MSHPETICCPPSTSSFLVQVGSKSAPVSGQLARAKRDALRPRRDTSILEGKSGRALTAAPARRVRRR